MISTICQRCKKVNKSKNIYFGKSELKRYFKLILNTIESYAKYPIIQTNSNGIKNITNLSNGRSQAFINFLQKINTTINNKKSIVISVLKIFSQVFGNTMIEYI